MVARLSALRAGRTLPQVSLFFKDSWYSFLLEAESTPGPVRPEGLGQFKKSTSSGLEPTTFRVFFLILVCEAIGTAAAPGLLCQPRVKVKMIVEKQMECRLAGETKFLEKTGPSATFVHHKIPHDQTRV
jgi:hypothetical protein